MGLSSDMSIRGACWANEVPRSSLRFLNGCFTGTARFVDSVNGSDGYDGLSSYRPLATISAAVEASAAGDTIYIIGSFNEAVTCSLAGVRFIGTGTGPRQAYWTAPTVVGSFCLKLAAGYCLTDNITFGPVIYTTSGVPSGIHLSGANHTQILNTRFQGKPGSYKAVYSPVCDSDNVVIDNCDFMYMNTATHGAGIYGVEAGGLSYSGWRITNTRFNSCVTDIDINGRACYLKGNSHPIGGITAAGDANAAVTTMAIDLSGTSSGANVVTGCVLGGEYDTDLYKPGATGDTWVGNYTMIETTDAPYGLTVVEPAAED